jgi:hypothetical protein
MSFLSLAFVGTHPLILWVCLFAWGGVSQWYYGADPQTPPWIKLGQPNKKIYTQAGWFWARECWNPHRQPILVAFYFVSFPIIVAFVMFSTFIGAVTGGMADAMDEFKEEEEKEKKKKAQKLADQADPK